ncbi:MAG: Tex family protein [Candidatus Zapsychrus exili]|nr:Tex family protein [Candidatus Zapsychrus exili]
MTKEYDIKISKELGLKTSQVSSTVKLLDDDATVPFIARYRKEVTGSLDEVVITSIRDRLKQLRELDKRRETVLSSIKEQGKLDSKLKKKILSAETITILEDIYLPYKPKRRTKATVAKEKGLELLAKKVFEQNGIDINKEAEKFIDQKKKVESVEDALLGARHIIAEWINENQEARSVLRDLFLQKAALVSTIIKGKEAEAIKYKDYYDLKELAKDCPSHRMLAVRRAEKEGFLTMSVLPDFDEAVQILKKQFVKGSAEDSKQVEIAAEDSYKRLLSVSLQTEIRVGLKKKADNDAIDIFKNNLEQLLMAPPLGQKSILAIDPGLRTGCKVVCLDKQGKLLANDTIYLLSDEQKQKAVQIIKDLCENFEIEVIAVGNGTASRETESFIKSIGLKEEIKIIMVSETGASVYSASDVAREEFPDYDITVRGSISIGRRLMDPLAELVKIDPKSIGVGQYQHDVDQNLLKLSLDDAVVSCVNRVGVELNTASRQLLSYVSGLGNSRAGAIIDFRDKNGAFSSREQLKKVVGLGPKAIEQAAGFLRIYGGDNPLDASAVHPERYDIVYGIAKDLQCDVKDLILKAELLENINLNKYANDDVGLPTLNDIKSELIKPGRDPREPFQLFSFKEGVNTLQDIEPGMKLPGIITNITAFGAFADIGVHQDGLIHISQLSEKYIKDPKEVVKLSQQVEVTVLEVDLPRKRIALTLKANA